MEKRKEQIMQRLPTVEESLDFEATKYPLKQNPALQRVGQCYFTELAHN